MNRTVNMIAGRLSLRPPQRDSLEILAHIAEILTLKKDESAALALEIVRSEFASVQDFEREFPSLCFALATGVGKTRLALRVLTDLQDEGAFPDGAWYVELAPLGDPALVAPTIAHTLGIPQALGRSPLDGLRAHVRGKTLLLVLDNFEHLLPAAPDVVELLAGHRRVQVADVVADAGLQAVERHVHRAHRGGGGVDLHRVHLPGEARAVE